MNENKSLLFKKIELTNLQPGSSREKGKGAKGEKEEGPKGKREGAKGEKGKGAKGEKGRGTKSKLEVRCSRRGTVVNESDQEPGFDPCPCSVG